MGVKWQSPKLLGPEDLFVGDEFLVAVPCCNGDKTRHWWEYSVITVTETGFEVHGSPWDWSWGDVEWFIPARDLEPPGFWLNKPMEG